MQEVNIIKQNEKYYSSNIYNNKLLTKIKDNFNENEQQLFINKFYCCFNYDKINDFIINLDDIWNWLGFSQKITDC